jgi:predicted RNA binding protein YcfA (HicA-like mRNA interferase family)
MKSVSGKELAGALDRHGWVLRRVHGSHHIYCKEGCNVRLSVPIHANRTLGAGLLAHLMRIAGLSESDL